MPDVAEIAKKLTEAQRAELLALSDFEIGKVVLRMAGVFPSRKQGRTALGLAVRAYLENSRATD